MDNKKIASTIIATAIAVNNISTTTVLSKPITTKHKTLKHSNTGEKVYRLNNNLEQEFISKNDKKFLKENVLSVVDIESNVFNEREFVSFIQEETIDIVKLATNLDLTNFKDEEVVVLSEGITIDGGGNSIMIPATDTDLDGRFFTIKGNNVTIKNVNFIVENKNNKLFRDEVDAISIMGDNIKLQNVNVKCNEGRGVNLYNSKNTTLDNVNIQTSKEHKSALKIDNGQVVLKDLEINNENGVGIEVVGSKSKVNIKDNLFINSSINIRAQVRDGAKIICDNEQIIQQEKFFGYEIYKAVKDEEIVKDEKQFLQIINNPNVYQIILKDNLDLRAYEKALLLRAMRNVDINSNKYHISFV